MTEQRHLHSKVSVPSATEGFGDVSVISQHPGTAPTALWGAEASRHYARDKVNLKSD